jgi:hypothetical protein
VRVVAKGRSAAIFVGDMARPALVVPRLARDPQPGGVALGGFLPPGVPGEGPIARFANVSVQADVADFDFASPNASAGSDRPESTTDPTDVEIVRAWSVSSAFVLSESAAPSLPNTKLLGEFRQLETEPNGLLPLHRHVRMPEKTNSAAAIARVSVNAARAGVYTFDLGFSDTATVFVNGRPIFRGEGSYSFDRPRREGLIGFDQARLYLPLTAGDNDLAIIVADSFGGWGLMGRFVAAQGVTVRAR